MKGTPSMGKKNKVTHARCRRCGSHSYNMKQKYCTSCNFGRSPKQRTYAWSKRNA